MIYRVIVIAGLTLGVLFPVYGEEVKSGGPKGVDEVTSDVVTNVFKKTNAFFQGNLEITMTEDKSRHKKDYTMNAIGEKVPKATERR